MHLIKQYPSKKEIELHNEKADKIFKNLLPIVEEHIQNNEYYSVSADMIKDDWIFALLLGKFGEHFSHSENICVSYIRIGGENGKNVEISFRVINDIIRQKRKKENEI